MRVAAAMLLVTVGASIASAQDRQAAMTLKRFNEAKPSEKSLAFYSLDWVCSLKEAKERAKAEERPILLILNTNITAQCDFYSGHT
jgi:hypothetical protein